MIQIKKKKKKRRKRTLGEKEKGPPPPPPPLQIQNPPPLQIQNPPKNLLPPPLQIQRVLQIFNPQALLRGHQYLSHLILVVLTLTTSVQHQLFGCTCMSHLKTFSSSDFDHQGAASARERDAALFGCEHMYACCLDVVTPKKIQQRSSV